MKLTPELVDYISTLSRLSLPEEEKNAMLTELDSIVSYMAVLDGLDVTDVTPMSHVFPVKNVLRDDQVTPSFPADLLLANAPASEFLVPKSVE